MQAAAPEPAAAGRRRAHRLRRARRRGAAGGGGHALARRSAATAPTASAVPLPPGRPRGVSSSATAPTRWRPRADGRSFSRTLRDRHEPPELDLTRRSVDPLQLGGKFFYLRELNGPGAAAGPVLVARLAAGPPCRGQLRDRAAQPDLAAAGQRPRRHPGRGRGRGGGGRAAGELAAAADQPDRPAAHGRADQLPGAGDRAVRRLPPHPVLQRASRRHLLRARRWVR